MYKPTASLIIETKDGINMVAGISKMNDEFLRFRQVIAGKTVLKKVREEDGLLYDDPLPLYIIRTDKIKNIQNIDGMLSRKLYYINEEDIINSKKILEESRDDTVTVQ